MNTGNQRSYIADKVRGELALVAAGAQYVSIIIVVAGQGENRVCEYVRVFLR